MEEQKNIIFENIEERERKAAIIVKKIATINAVILLILASTVNLPYTFYFFLRYFICSITIWLAWLAFVSSEGLWLFWCWSFSITAFVFNPIIPLGLGRNIWRITDLLVSALLIGSLFTFNLAKIPEYMPEYSRGYNWKKLVTIFVLLFAIRYVVLPFVMSMDCSESDEWWK